MAPGDDIREEKKASSVRGVGLTVMFWFAGCPEGSGLHCRCMHGGEAFPRCSSYRTVNSALWWGTSLGPAWQSLASLSHGAVSSLRAARRARSEADCTIELQLNLPSQEPMNEAAASLERAIGAVGHVITSGNCVGAWGWGCWAHQ